MGYEFNAFCHVSEGDAAQAWCNAQGTALSCSASGAVVTVTPSTGSAYVRTLSFPECRVTGTPGDQVDAMNILFGLFAGVLAIVWGGRQVLKVLRHGREER